MAMRSWVLLLFFVAVVVAIAHAERIPKGGKRPSDRLEEKTKGDRKDRDGQKVSNGGKRPNDRLEEKPKRDRKDRKKQTKKGLKSNDRKHKKGTKSKENPKKIFKSKDRKSKNGLKSKNENKRGERKGLTVDKPKQKSAGKSPRGEKISKGRKSEMKHRTVIKGSSKRRPQGEKTLKRKGDRNSKKIHKSIGKQLPKECPGTCVEDREDCQGRLRGKRGCSGGDFCCVQGKPRKTEVRKPCTPLKLCDKKKGECRKKKAGCNDGEKMYKNNKKKSYCSKKSCVCCAANCSTKKKCSKLNGICQMKKDPCDGTFKKSKKYCSGKKCGCCIPGGSNTCITRKICSNADGTCQPLTEACDGELKEKNDIGKKYCKGKSCGCCLPSGGGGSCESLLSVVSSWNDGWNGNVSIPILTSITSWKVDIQFTAPLTSFEQWDGETTSHSSTHYSVSQDNDPRATGDMLVFEILYRFNEGASVPSIQSIKLNDQEMCTNGGGCAAEGSPYDYDEVLHKSLLFYEAQRSGVLPESQRVTWRKDSATDDAIDDATNQQVDLEGGYYDAGDHVKFGFPMAGMTTVLAWGAIEYGAAYTASGEMPYMKEAVKWATDYFIKAHPEANVFYGQVGNGTLDHDYWGRPEDMTMDRPAFKITVSSPGSDLAGETAAALAAASILFQDSDSTYATTCRQHAIELYDFAKQHQGKYANSITDAVEYYNSEGFYDELAWAAVWLYRATGEAEYLTQAEEHYSQLSNAISEFSWDEKTAGVQVLLAEYADETDRSSYLNDLKIFCDRIIDDTQRTPLGLVFINEWGPLGYAANAAFVCLRAADLGISPTKYREFGKEQIHYMLGDGGRSYVVGFGENPPVRPHHASSSCPSAPASCGWENFDSTEPNAHEVTGALVGGPDAKDNFKDDRSNIKTNEVATDYNAGFQSSVAALRVLATCGNRTIKSAPASPNPSVTVSLSAAQTVDTQSMTVPPNRYGPKGSTSCTSLLVESSAWNSGWNGTVNIPISTTFSSWTLEFEFTSPLTSFEQWRGEIATQSNSLFVVSSKDNDPMLPGDLLSFEIIYQFNEGTSVPSIQSIKLNGQEMCTNVGTML